MMRDYLVCVPFFSSLIGFGCLLTNTDSVYAQLIPDTSLKQENSQVQQLNQFRSLIEGGATRGDHLFHSFLEFNVGNLQSVYFANPNGINNILTRVTGSNTSNILGTLGVKGNANLFLFNPNGFVFGKNATLDLNGSFTTTTEAIDFGTNGVFNQTSLPQGNLLTIQPNASFNNLTGKIENQANLVVQQGQDLVLVADQIENSGNLSAVNGSVTLQANQIIQVNGSVTIQGNQINLVNGSSSQNAGQVVIQANNLTLSQLANTRLKPDNSLGTENTRIQNVSSDRDRIIGGAQRGTNLFHSFAEFNIDRNKKVAFFTPTNVANILARVTGNDISNIDGRIAVQGSEANLFLLNPNGIIFGEDAALNLSASFVVSTAESIAFQDNTVFSSNLNNTSSLLSITEPTGLNFGNQVGSITNLSFANNFFGLVIPANNTFTLLGGEIEFAGGIISADEARVEIGSLAPNSFVDITQDQFGWKPIYRVNEQFQDINFNSSAFIAGFGDFGSDIRLQGRNINFTEGSQLFSGAFGSIAGNITITASESINLSGTDGFFPSGFFIELEETATGKGKFLSVQSKNLVITNGAQIFAGNFGVGKGIDLNIKVSEKIRIQGGGTVNNEILPSAIFSEVFDQGTGKGGNINIETKQIMISNGGQVSTSTRGKGNAGNVNIISSESIQVIGRNSQIQEASGIFAQVRENATGNGGVIEINAAKLSIKDGAQIVSAGRNSGKGGDIILNVDDTILLDGLGELARQRDRSGLFVSAEAFSTADAGTLRLNADKLIISNGARISGDTLGEGKGADVDINVSELVVQDGGNIGAGSLLRNNPDNNQRGDGGTVKINAQNSIAVTASTIVNDTVENSSIFTRAEGTGDAGNLEIQTPQLTIAEGGNISANTLSTDGGNIAIDAFDSLFLIDGGSITTSAGTAQAGGDGGNITLNSPVIVSFPSNPINSITANAFTGDGGNIEITTTNIFGSEFLEITASSEFGLDGTIAITDPDVDPSSGLVIIDPNFVDAERLIAQNPCKDVSLVAGKGSQFIILGNGGLPPQSLDLVNKSFILTPWLEFSPTTPNNEINLESKNSNNLSANRLCQWQDE